MAPLTVKQLKEMKKKATASGDCQTEMPTVALTVPPKPIDLDETSSTESDLVRAKRKRGTEAEVNSAKGDTKNPDGFHAPPPQSLMKQKEWRAVLKPVTGDGTVTTIYDNHFAFPELIDSFLISQEDEAKIKSLGLIGACRAIEAFTCYSAAIARSVETQFGDALEECKRKEEEVALVQQRAGELEQMLEKTTKETEETRLKWKTEQEANDILKAEKDSLEDQLEKDKALC